MIQRTNSGIITPNNPGCFQANRREWVELAESAHFARDSYYHLSSLNYAVVPAIDDGDETLPQVRFKNQYLQERIADVNSTAFDNANSALIIIDDMETKFLFIDLDLHKQGTAKHTQHCLLYTSPSPRDRTRSRMPSSA